jgi:hypothetical protein
VYVDGLRKTPKYDSGFETKRFLKIPAATRGFLKIRCETKGFLKISFEIKGFSKIYFVNMRYLKFLVRPRGF